tara:strand:- start:397 stop:558 length:162 start_codon:yes stop_codon:yes gene_type:complete
MTGATKVFIHNTSQYAWQPLENHHLQPTRQQKLSIFVKSLEIELFKDKLILLQ